MEQSQDSLSEEGIERALAAARLNRVAAEQQRADLNRVIEAARQEERLLEGLLDLRRGGSAKSQADLHESEGAHSEDSLGMVSGRRRSKQPVVQAVIDELATAGRPTHISELMRVLRARDVRIPGAGTQANLITHLRRDSRLVRTSRGMYGLAIWGLESTETPRPIRRRRKHVRATKTS